MKSRGVDPADYVGADDLGLLLDDEVAFTVELQVVEACPSTVAFPSTPHIADVVLRARWRR